MRTLRYKITIRPETDGTYTVIVPSLPGCLTFGDTIEEALEMAKEAIEAYIESLAARGIDIPVEEDQIEATITVEANALDHHPRSLPAGPIVPRSVWQTTDSRPQSLRI